MKYVKKPVVIEAITFEQLVAHGLDQDGATVHADGVPWSFLYQGYYIMRENDDCYLIPSDEGTTRFNRGELLVTSVYGEIYPVEAKNFYDTYEPVSQEVPPLQDIGEQQPDLIAQQRET